MKKLIMILSLVVSVSCIAFGNVSQYKINDEQIESLFSSAQEVTTPILTDIQDLPSFPIGSAATVSSDKNPAVAFILAFFLGPLGIHRFYLGTETLTWVGYILTCGGIFGIVPFIDWIVLLVGLVEDDIGKYVNNPKFFMWL